MSSLVSEFLINPVLRQARRFSRSGTPVHTHNSNDPATSHPVQGVNNEVNEVIIEDVIEGEPVMDLPDAREHAAIDNIIQSLSNPSATHGDGGNSSSDIPHEVERNQPVAPMSLQSNMSQDDSDISGDHAPSIASQAQDNITEELSSSAALNALDLHMSSAEGLSHNLSQNSTSASLSLDTGSSALPADDGMGPLRQRIKYIQAMDTPTERKALLMHQLLTQGYTEAHETFHAKNYVSTTAAEEMISQERPATPSSLSSYLWQMNGVLDPVPVTESHTFHLSPDDLKRTYAPLDPPEVDDGSEESENTEDSIPKLGCKHYKRNVKLQCSTCDRWYTCRLCHDEVEDHILIRHDTKNMLCMICGCAQRAGEFCVECGERTAWYYCGVCKLWDNDPNKSIYHCNDCGICRKGRGLGKDFFHCKVGSIQTNQYICILLTISTDLWCVYVDVRY